MSIELKYRLTLAESSLRKYAFLLPVGFLLALTPTMSDALWTRISASAYGAILGCLALALWFYQQRFRRQLPSTVMLSQSGQWEVLAASEGNAMGSAKVQETDFGPWQLTRRSKVTALAVYLDFEHISGRRRHHWVLANECSTQDFRRLVRIIRNLPSKR